MQRFIYILLTLLLLSCSPKSYIDKVVSNTTRDSTTRVRIEVTYSPRDTIILAPLPQERAENTTRDTTSTLSTSVATSTATISGGVLHHTLTNRDTTIATRATINDQLTVIDSTTTNAVTTIEQVTEVVEVNRLTWWQTALCWIGGVVSLLTILYIVYKLKRFLI